MIETLKMLESYIDNKRDDRLNTFKQARCCSD